MVEAIESTEHSIKCEKCGKIRLADVEAMPICSLRYRLLDGDLCHGHKRD